MSVTTIAFSIQLINYDLGLLLVPMILHIARLCVNDASSSPLIPVTYAAFYFELVMRADGARSFNGSWFLFALLVVLLAIDDRRQADPTTQKAEMVVQR